MALKSKTRVVRDAGSGMAFDRLLEEEGCTAHDVEVALVVDPGMSLLAVLDDVGSDDEVARLIARDILDVEFGDLVVGG